MSEGDAPARPTREVIAQREIGRTDISAGLAWLMTVSFLFTLAVPPAAQLVHELCLGGASGAPTCLALFHVLPEVADVFERAEGSLWNRVLAANRRLLRHIEEYEKQLEDRSLLTQHLLGPTQNWLTGMAGLGNENAYVGRGGWLLYRPDVDYLTGPGFLEAAVLHRRALGDKSHLAPPLPDPRPAILEFHEQLARRGIRLIVMPMPGKSAIHPERLSSRFDGSEGPLENPSFPRLCQELRDAGVLVFDPAPFMTRQKRASKEIGQFLRTDTHWAPDAMQLVAGQLKDFIDRHCLLPPRPPVEFGERMREVENLGDIAIMLHLPEDQTLFPPEKVTIREVVEPDGRPWEPDEGADVLLLGDSYTNIYSLPEMNWGSTAGLAERLSFALRRPVDRLAQNDGGSHAVRQALYQQLARGHDRLAGKRIVIWEFAVRELAFGDWKTFPMPEPSPAEDATHTSPPSPSAGAPIVRGTVRAAGGAPQPGSVPYRDAVTGVHLDGVEGVGSAFPHGEIVVYLWGMRDNRLVSAAKFVPGQKVTLRLTAWDTVREKYERFNRIELDDPDFRLAELPTYWAEEAP
ncbi:MAG: alginate O-acetyltransferase AlgX-related protein [Deltaproteobacteria bacterium]